MLEPGWLDRQLRESKKASLLPAQARAWANGLENGIGPDQMLVILPVDNVRLLIDDLRCMADALDLCRASQNG